MRSVAKRKAGLQPIKRYSHGGRNDHDHDADGNPVYTPNKADTLRLVNANQAQIQELLDQGYVEYDSEPVSDKEIQIETTRKNRGLFADNDISLREIESAMLDKPHLAFDLLPPGYDKDFGFIRLGFKTSFLEDYVRKVENLINDNKRDLSYDSRTLARLIEGIEDYRYEMLNFLGSNSEKPVLRRIMQNLSNIIRNYEAEPGLEESDISKAAEELKKVGKGAKDLNDTVLQASSPYGARVKRNTLGSPSSAGFEDAEFFRDKFTRIIPKANRFYSAINISKPGAINIDEIKDLYSQGYGFDYGDYQQYKDSKGKDVYIDSYNTSFYGKGSMMSTKKAKTILKNAGSRIYNDLFATEGKVEEIDRGDLGVERIVTKGNKREIEKIPEGKIMRFENIYPVHGTDTRIRKIQFYPPYNQREFLDGRFYLDREAEGTGAVRRDDLVKTLFNYDIAPNRKILFFNKDLNDIVSVYSYDSPEFRRYGDDPGDEEGGGGGGGGGGVEVAK